MKGERQSGEVHIAGVSTPCDLIETRSIFSEYALSLGVDLSFQDFEAELKGLPGEYIAPLGGLLLVWVDGAVAGCCALRPLVTADHENAAEMKRLYVRPAYRQRGIGRLLAQSMWDSAQVAGYHSVLLDTLDDMESARAL